jgi:hypothetical protein
LAGSCCAAPDGRLSSANREGKCEQSPFSTVAPLQISHCSKSTNNIEPVLYSTSYPSDSTTVIPLVQLEFDIPRATPNLHVSNPRCTTNTILLIQRYLQLLIQLDFGIPHRLHPPHIEPALYGHRYSADSTNFLPVRTTGVRYYPALFLATSNLCCTMPAISLIPGTIRQPHILSCSILRSLATPVFHWQPRLYRIDSTKLLWCSSPFWPGACPNAATDTHRKYPQCRSSISRLHGGSPPRRDLHSFCTASKFTPSAHIRPFHPLHCFILEFATSIYIIMCVIPSSAFPSHPNSRVTLISNLCWTNVEPPLEKTSNHCCTDREPLL